ncbi:MULTISPECIES: glycosyltransferase family 2 protein [unclassified Caballeronia]|uniref:glycosyltransferase family 2 protein n=1 Tax=unclassified Caballeronia TaxID=2646786 RepID=UPI001F2BADEF|nr:MULTISPECIES: glycosyltransferase [unclassified Caballeronia]MCE4547423.1 glycosyltransferase [Caballeronia sp. PC1]MCE4575408.1 glycosyltransferase [Caballeronia sp. CLC5]
MTAERAVNADENCARLSVVVLTYNRADQVLDTLARLAALPDRIDIVVVDNASTDGAAARIAENFPLVKLVVAPRNLGAAGRNLGVARVHTEYVAFCDDDTWWSPGALTRAVEVLDAAPRVGVLNARVVVGEHGAADDTCERMRDSPLPRDGLPGPALIGFMAGACVFRTEVFRQAGGYEPRLFIGGEEMLVSLDVLGAGHEIVYIDELVLHHHPSPLRDSAQRRRLLARNAAWVAWMRLPLAEALRATYDAFRLMRAEPWPRSDVMALLQGVAWALARRRVIDERVRQMRELVHEDDARREAQTADRGPVGSTRAT